MKKPRAAVRHLGWVGVQQVKVWSVCLPCKARKRLHRCSPAQHRCFCIRLSSRYECRHRQAKNKQASHLQGYSLPIRLVPSRRANKDWLRRLSRLAPARNCGRTLAGLPSVPASASASASASVPVSVSVSVSVSMSVSMSVSVRVYDRPRPSMPSPCLREAPLRSRSSSSCSPQSGAPGIRRVGRVSWYANGGYPAKFNAVLNC